MHRAPIDRRLFLKSAGIALATAGFAPPFLRRAVAATPPRGRKVLVVVLQRGAADGLAMVPPHAEPRARSLRPTLGLLPPGGGDGAALRLDDTFGLHPALAPLHPLYGRGALAAVHAVGSPHPTRSHFDAQDYLESGTPGRKSTGDGWLNRTIGASRAAAPDAGAAFRAVALSPTLPRSLAGPESALATASLAELSVRGGEASARSFEELYAGAVDGALRGAGTEAFDAVRRLRDAAPSRLLPENGAVYPSSELGRRMREIAQLVRADLGLEVAATDCGGWDTHTGQGAARGALASRLDDLGKSLAAFATDLGDRLEDVCVVTMTEFGRTVRENGSRGTDHGHGSVMLLLGGRVDGGRVVARWKGLADADLHEGRDLPATLDHRDVLAEVLRAHLGVRDLASVFPGFSPSPPGLFRG